LETVNDSNVDDSEMELARATPEEKENCLIRVTDRQTLTPKQTAEALKQLQEVARLGGNVFEELMETVKVASLGQITDAMFNVGGQYRRNM
jgi:isobutyryl-CoA mutase